MKWIGPGVLRIGKKDYGYGNTIPSKGLSPERIAQLKKRGKIGEIPVAGPDPEIVRLKAQIAELEATAKAFQSKGRKLEAEGKNLAAENAVLQAELEKQQAGDADAAPEPATLGDGAGPKSDEKGKQK